MENKIKWESDMEKALARARSEEKFVLLKAKYPTSEWTKRAYPYRLL